MDFHAIEKLLDGKTPPVIGKNDKGENVVIEAGRDESGRFYRIEASQNNGWLRITTIYENGDRDETFRK